MAKLLLKINALQKVDKKYFPFSLAVNGICSYLRRPNLKPRGWPWIMSKDET